MWREIKTQASEWMLFVRNVKAGHSNATSEFVKGAAEALAAEPSSFAMHAD